ncbi:uncharacterized protein LOC122061220 [Macadamia integrifolia]|uniref:uncharacterized protein LOC122061220 n=1 Tax=Macadamia integrifolia TaxID=60698 RepID=UPI001C5280EA|nr:uncharacterized protein LOC122061220 [Macadamia integrifolia]
MEEIREAALAYYEAGTDELKQTAVAMFRSMDVDGNGWISITEFENFLKKNRYSVHYDRKLFFEIDRDRNNFLDFEEVIIFFYMTQTKKVLCDGCRSLIKGTYFICSDCFCKTNNNGYDLCCACYRSKKFGQGHGPFVDNYSILLSIRNLLQQQQQEQQQQQAQVVQQREVSSSRTNKDGRGLDELQLFLKAFKVGLDINQVTNTLASQGVCSIM